LAWYQNPTIAAVLGGIAGAILSIIASIFIWRKTHKVKRVDCLIHDVSSLLTVSDKIKDQLEVSYSGKKAESVYFISLEVINSGNEAVENQPVNIRLAEKSNIIDYSMKTNPPVGFGAVNQVSQSANGLDMTIDLMNPGDKVSFEIVSIDNEDDSIDVYLKNANVATRIISSQNGEVSLSDLMSEKNMLFLAMMSAIPFFGGFARSMINVGLAQRIGKLSK
tara:strand:+ start:300 stop:962 length:663 start_codon:yes stop_codon:yes gene_type:complete